MTKEEIRAVNCDRLAQWEEILADQHCTAMVLVAVGHDGRSGQLHVCHVEGPLTGPELAEVLQSVVVAFRRS